MVVKVGGSTLSARFTPKGIGTIFRRCGITATRTGSKRLFRPTENQWRAFAQSYGIAFDQGA